MFEQDTKSKVLFLFVILFLVIAINANSKTIDKKIYEYNDTEKYMYGYLKKEFSWTDEFGDVYRMNALGKTGKVHGVIRDTKIEIHDLDIMTTDGNKNQSIVMIYFLEGEYAGRWGYTLRAFVRN